MDGIEWLLTHKLREGESLKTNLKMCSVWDLNAFRTSESYTKPSEIASYNVLMLYMSMPKSVHLFLSLSENFTA